VTTSAGRPGTAHVEVRRGAYADSVTLLAVSRDVAATPGVLAAQVAMATPLNVEVLAGMGFEVPPCTVDDLLVAIRVKEPDRLPAALAAVELALAGPARRTGPGGPVPEVSPRTVGSAAARAGAAPGAALALVSVPGEHAAVEAWDALAAGLDVMVFSDNVPVEQEVALKDAAAGRGLLVMGPDCGTAVVGGVGLGFANVTRAAPGEGAVGVVAASGTGCQQLLCLLDAAGVGVGAALGVGGRDLSAEVRGRSTREALRRLDADPAVERIVLVSKPPAPEVAQELQEYAASLVTPVHLALLGRDQPDLTATVEALLLEMGLAAPTWPTWGSIDDSVAPGVTEGRWLRGLFVGGTLCDEAMLVAEEWLGPVRSNIPLTPEVRLDPAVAAGVPDHVMLDFGDDALTRGRAHPMIDPTLRLQHLADVAADPTTSVVLLDLVLGHGTDPDPAARLAPAVEAALERAGRDARRLSVVVTCVGTDQDPQRLGRQARRLAEAGAEVYLSNAQAVGRAVGLLPPEVLLEEDGIEEVGPDEVGPEDRVTRP
jgi:FdrA protein